MLHFDTLCEPSISIQMLSLFFVVIHGCLDTHIYACYYNNYCNSIRFLLPNLALYIYIYIYIYIYTCSNSCFLFFFACSFTKIRYTFDLDD